MKKGEICDQVVVGGELIAYRKNNELFINGLRMASARSVKYWRGRIFAAFWPQKMKVFSAKTGKLVKKTAIPFMHMALVDDKYLVGQTHFHKFVVFDLETKNIIYERAVDKFHEFVDGPWLYSHQDRTSIEWVDNEPVPIGMSRIRFMNDTKFKILGRSLTWGHGLMQFDHEIVDIAANTLFIAVLVGNDVVICAWDHRVLKRIYDIPCTTSIALHENTLLLTGSLPVQKIELFENKSLAQKMGAVWSAIEECPIISLVERLKRNLFTELFET